MAIQSRLPPVQPQATVSIQLLGPFGLQLAQGVPAGQGGARLGRRAAELLQLLSLTPQRSLSHDQVLDALWPHLDPVAGSANLRKAAFMARQFVGQPDALVLQGGRVFLLPKHPVECDAWRFEQAADEALAAADAAACLEACRLYAGDLLPEVPYESWVQAPRRRLRDKYLRLLRQAGEFERVAQEEPADEEAHLALMRSELAAGRPAAALRWWGHLRDHLQSVHGVRPGPRIEALYRECLVGLQDDSPAFVGRSVELAQALAALERAVGDDPQDPAPAAGLLVRGEAGMGKTAFGRRLASEARQRGWQVRRVHAADWTRPYGLVTDLVEPLLREADEAALQALGAHARSVLFALTPAAGPAAALALPIGRHQVAGAVRRLLLATAQGRPVLLLADDAHAADDASAELLAHLSASGPSLFVVLACRPSLPTVLGGHVRRLLRAGTFQAIELQALGQEEAAVLAQRSASSPMSDAVAAQIARRSQGLPFAVVELARTQGAAATVSAGLPRSVSEALAQRLADAGAGEAGLHALRRIALAGEALDLDVALALAGDSPQEGSAGLDRALAAGILAVQSDAEGGPGRYRFGHSLVRDALLDALAPHQRVALHREVAQRLSAVSTCAGTQALHWLAAREPDRALPCLLDAARKAFRLGAFDDVLRQVDPLLEHFPAHAEALALKAESFDALGRIETLAAYDEAARVADEVQSHELRAKRALAQVKMSDPAGALVALRTVHPTTTPGRLAAALAYSGAAALGAADPAEGTRRAGEVRRLAIEMGDEGTLVIASWAHAAAAHARGELHESVWADLQETRHLPQLAVRVFDGHLCITQRFLYGSRPYADVIAFADALATEARRIGAARGHAFAVTLRGEARLLSGQLDAAEQDLVEGGRLHRGIAGATGEALSLQRRAELALHRRDLPRAQRLLDEALDVSRQSGVGFHLLDRIYGTRIRLARNARAAMGALEEAESAVHGPLETCPGCRITFAVPATIVAARARETELARRHLGATEYLARVVMKLPAWDAALIEAQGHVHLAAGDVEAARVHFEQATQVYQRAGHVLDAARCEGGGPGGFGE